MADISTTRQLVKQARAVRKLLADEGRWVKATLAENNVGEEVDPCSRTACRFCLVGAVAHVAGIKDRDGINVYCDVAKHPLGVVIGNTILGMTDRGHTASDKLSAEIYVLEGFNDRNYICHEDVMEVLNTTVAMIEGAVAAGVEV